MVFTLEPEQKWLQDYDVVRKRLKGNIKSKEEIQLYVDFVKHNYKIFRAAWDYDQPEFNA